MSYFLHSNQVVHTERFKPKHVYVFTGPCIDDPNDIVTVVLNAQDLYKYHQGALIQNAFPYLTASQCEWMITGLSDKGFEDATDED